MATQTALGEPGREAGCDPAPRSGPLSAGCIAPLTAGLRGQKAQPLQRRRSKNVLEGEDTPTAALGREGEGAGCKEAEGHLSRQQPGAGLREGGGVG